MTAVRKTKNKFLINFQGGWWPSVDGVVYLSLNDSDVCMKMASAIQKYSRSVTSSWKRFYFISFFRQGVLRDKRVGHDRFNRFCKSDSVVALFFFCCWRWQPENRRGFQIAGTQWTTSSESTDGGQHPETCGRSVTSRRKRGEKGSIELTIYNTITGRKRRTNSQIVYAFYYYFCHK